jgi:hypothetical protein
VSEHLQRENFSFAKGKTGEKWFHCTLAQEHFTSQVNVKVKFTLEQHTNAQRGSGIITHPFLNLGARWGWMINATLQLLYTRERDMILIVEETGWAPGPVWTGVENLAPTGIRSPDRQVRSESLYRLSYRGPHVLLKHALNINSDSVWNIWLTVTSNSDGGILCKVMHITGMKSDQILQ